MADDMTALQSTGHTTAPFVRNTWYVAMWSHEVEAGKMASRTILGEPVLFFRREDGSLAAISDTCSHRFAPLSMGQLMPGDRVQCPYHGLEFGADGKCVHNPHGSGAIPQAAHLRAYPTVERHKLIWIWMGHKAPDASKIPDYSCIDKAEPIHLTDPGYIKMSCNYELLVDNLLDLSHIAYLHAGLLGNSDTLTATIEMKTEGDSVTVSRPAFDVETPNMLLMQGAVPRGDQYNSITLFAPSCLLLVFGAGPAGGPISDGTGYYAIHLITPESAHSTHYIFTAVRWGVKLKDDVKNEEIRAKIGAGRRFAFAEQDQPVIEAQQQRMDLSETPLQPVLLSIDAGPVQYQRILERMRREDRS